ncbi:MAG: hypothetical protein WBL74_03785 [Novosphingobium sp.]|uniref:hypothetical protein n=1 Tax=Novosphingobium sp. TaxID=1874826 RepID=UPI003C7A9418
MIGASPVLEAENFVLRRSDDDHSKGVFDPAARGKTDRFVLKFRRLYTRSGVSCKLRNYP